MAIGFGVACPKGKTRKQVKAKRDRADAKALKQFRDAVWKREGVENYCEGDSRELGRCQKCHRIVGRGGGDVMTGEVHHRIGRRHKAHRYDPDNGVLLCNHLVNNCHARAENGDI